MPTYYETINDQFSGSTLNLNIWIESGYTSGISESGGALNLETSTTLNQATWVLGKSTNAADNTPLLPQTSTCQIISETAVTLNGQRSSGGAQYAVYAGVEMQTVDVYFEFQIYTSSGTGTGTVYTMETANKIPSGSYLTNTITTFNYGTKIWLRVSVDNTGSPTYQYSTNGTSWTTATAPTGFVKFGTNYQAYPYMLVEPYNAAGSQYTFPYDYLTYQITDPPIVSFTATSTSGTSGLTTSFTDTSPGTFTAWSWTFGDGGTSTSQNPTHTYTTEGVYSVSLTATDYVGSNTYTATNLVNVGGQLTGIGTLTGVGSLTI